MKRFPELPDEMLIPERLREGMRPIIESAEQHLSKYGECYNEVKERVQHYQHRVCKHPKTRKIEMIDPNHPFGSQETRVPSPGKECVECRLQFFPCAKCKGILVLESTERSVEEDWEWNHNFICSNSRCSDKMVLNHDNPNGGGPLVRRNNPKQGGQS